MVFQAKTFENSCNNEYARLADNIFHPMNEFLLFFIEQGIILSILGLIILSLYLFKIKKTTPQYLCLTAILTFSFFSYPFKYPLTLFMLAYVLSFCKLPQVIIITLRFPIYLIIGILNFIWFGYIIRDIKNNYIWNKIYNKTKLGQFCKVKNSYRLLSEDLQSNASFMFNYSTILYKYGYYHESLFYVKNNLYLENNYDIQLLLADNYYKLGNSQLAIHHYRKASLMCPNRFSPLYGMFIVYHTDNNVTQAINLGHIILTKPIKVKSRNLRGILLDVQEKTDLLEKKLSKGPCSNVN